jgi:hypothetical protein
VPPHSHNDLVHRTLKIAVQQGRTEVRDAKRIMSVTFADAGEAVSRPCLKMWRHLLTRPPSACRDRLFFPSGYVEDLNDARTLLEDIFSILLVTHLQ